MSVANRKAESRSAMGLGALDLGDIQEKLKNGILTSEALVKACDTPFQPRHFAVGTSGQVFSRDSASTQTYHARTTKVNGRVRAIGCLNPDPVAIAVERDDQRRDGKILG